MPSQRRRKLQKDQILKKQSSHGSKGGQQVKVFVQKLKKPTPIEKPVIEVIPEFEEDNTPDFQCLEYSLKGLIDTSNDFDQYNKAIALVRKNSSIESESFYKDECWRLHSGDTSKNFLSSSLESCKEVWVRKYAYPAHLVGTFALRMFGAEHQTVPPNFPTNAKRVTEAVCSSSIVSVLKFMGFRKSARNDAFAHVTMFQTKCGTTDHAIITFTRFYKDANFNVPMWPGRVVVELKSRNADEDHSNVVAASLLALASHLKPVVHLSKLSAAA
eukprot:GHVP01053723.1.p1 GENE.GHVP01053723.1~~GHVP01053723.1.p1  ORF type:complete len:272 (+),score=32.99 GHVP01053723.1:747-1562(+)